MSVPQVVIVGRPNVGKSSLFNWLAGQRLAIVDDTPGVTRDRVTHLVCEDERYFELVDTGGIGLDVADDLTAEIEHQIQVGIDAADVLLFVVDTRTGPTPLDQLVAERLRLIDKPIICVANKTDDSRLEPQADEFYRLGCGSLLKVSAHQNRNRDLLVRMIVDRLPTADAAPPPGEPEMMIALVGRQNVGKSTFINSLTRTERMIVSEIPGTTRDSVDVRFELDGKAFIAIDTPGLRRRKSVRTDVDFYSLHRAQRSIRRADVVLMMFDATQTLTKVDKQLCHYIADQYKPCVFVVNKWDLLVGQTATEPWVEYVRNTFPTMRYVPIAFITGRTGKNMKALLNHAQMLFKQARQRVGTGVLNRLVRAAIEYSPPPTHQNRQPKIYYATQLATQPPTIVMICNHPQAFAPTYQRYLLGVFRDELPFGEVPIKLYLQPRSRNDRRDDFSEASPRT